MARKKVKATKSSKTEHACSCGGNCSCGEWKFLF